MEQLFLLITFLCFATEGAPFEDEHMQVISVDQGSNLTLPCGSVKLTKDMGVMWVKEVSKEPIHNTVQSSDGSILFTNVQKSDSGVYSCRLEADYKTSIEDLMEARVRIRVRTAPLAPRNVTVTPFTISASVEWAALDDDGGYPVRNFQIAYHLKFGTDKDWKSCLPALIPPDLRQYSLYHLQPNSTYLVKVWGNNKLGSGMPTVVEITTKNDPQEIELKKHFLDGVDSFDVRIWIIAVGIVVTTLVVLGVATCCLFYKEYNMNLMRVESTDGESIELMPNIILNPGYDFQSMELRQADENSNDTTALRINNNSVIFPSRV